ncbi:hypothetical protein SAMN05192583_3521 [Sphingomonas gellani]|uniref:Uncharacterized protein n=1 Tax=Sphingomonas gellani TaxID=1166340 RepID=A0A1H8J7V3_9SPHN|nr:hypothetical protein [Sphingomonas gellani]SEN76854.1 hypothetical protein SAMN05192583_3521 [Sphingomonas gellani]
MFARLARVTALLILSLILATVCSALLAQEGALGSCFEGSCGYIGAFFCVPLLTITFYIFFKKLTNRWLGHKPLLP